MEESFQQERDRVLANLPRIVTEISGRIGNVLFTKRDGKTGVFPAPDTGPTGPAPEKVAQATKYRELKADTERLLQDPLQRTYYETVAAKKRISPFAVLFAELFRARMRQDKRRAGAKKEAREKRVAERKNRGQPRGPGFPVPQAGAGVAPLAFDAFLALIPSLSPAESYLLRAKLQESVARLEEGLREQGAGI